MPSEVRIALEFKYSAGGVHRVFRYTLSLGAIVRNGRRYEFLPEPFVPFTKDQLEQITAKIYELEKEADADPT